MANHGNVDPLDNPPFRLDRHDHHARGQALHAPLLHIGLGDDLAGGHLRWVYRDCYMSRRHDHGKLEAVPNELGEQGIHTRRDAPW